MSFFSSFVSSVTGGDSTTTTDSTTSTTTQGDGGVSMASIGSFFSGIATKIKDVIEEQQNELAAEKEKLEKAALAEEQAVIESQHVIIPWEDIPPETDSEVAEAVRKQILSLSKNKRNFLENPPADVSFDFDYDQYLPTCIECIKADPQLGRIRFYLVPQFVREQRFWRNYFYRVQLIREAHGLPSRRPTPSESSKQLPSNPSSSSVPTPTSSSSASSTSLVNDNIGSNSHLTPVEEHQKDEEGTHFPKHDEYSIAIALEGTNEFISDEMMDATAMKAWEAELKAELDSITDTDLELDTASDLDDKEFSDKINKELGL